MYYTFILHCTISFVYGEIVLFSLFPYKSFRAIKKPVPSDTGTVKEKAKNPDRDLFPFHFTSSLLLYLLRFLFMQRLICSSTYRKDPLSIL